MLKRQNNFLRGIYAFKNNLRDINMKKVIAFAALSLLPLSQAMADQDIGCGLGSVLFEGKQGKVVKVVGATTNGLFGNQTFGITFGTLGCDGTGTVTSSAKLSKFIDGNVDALASDMAKGDGETLTTLAAVWGFNEQEQAEFKTLTQDNFDAVFTSENVTSQDVLENLNQLVTNSDSLSSYTLS